MKKVASWKGQASRLASTRAWRLKCTPALVRCLMLGPTKPTERARMTMTARSFAHALGNSGAQGSCRHFCLWPRPSATSATRQCLEKAILGSGNASGFRDRYVRDKYGFAFSEHARPKTKLKKPICIRSEHLGGSFLFHTTHKRTPTTTGRVEVGCTCDFKEAGLTCGLALRATFHLSPDTDDPGLVFCLPLYRILKSPGLHRYSASCWTCFSVFPPPPPRRVEAGSGSL